MHENGKAIRKIYVEHLKFLPKYYEELKPEEIYLRSTKYERTIESLQQLISGIYPQKYINKNNKQTDSNNSNNLFIRIRDKNSETLFPDFNSKMFLDMFNKHKNDIKPKLSDQWNKLRSDLITNTNFKTELKISNDMFMEIHKLYDTICSANSHGVLNIKGFDLKSYKILEEIHTKMWFGGMQDSKQMLQLSIGGLFNELKNKLEYNKNNLNKEKLSIFSGHDT